MGNQDQSAVVPSDEGAMSCEHPTLEVTGRLQNIRDEQSPDTPIVRRYVEVTIKCATCLHQFYFDNVPVGMLGSGPTTSPDGTVMLVPISPIRGISRGNDNAAISQQIDVQIVRANRGPSG